MTKYGSAPILYLLDPTAFLICEDEVREF